MANKESQVKEQDNTPTGPLEALYSFISSRPPWEQDAVRRLYQLGSLSQKELDEVFDLFCAENNLPLAENAYSEQPKPLKKTQLENPIADNESIRIKKIHSVENVARLAHGQEINVGSNLTIIYGNNGAGKSGYIRILKKACGARNSLEVLANVKKANFKSLGPSTVALDCYTQNQTPDAATSIAWNTSLAADSRLSRVQVFDSHVAKYLIEKDNNLAIVPYNFDLLEKLAKEVFEKLKGIISTKKAALQTETDTLLLTLPDDSFKTREAIEKLSLSIDIEELDKKLSPLTQEEENRFEQLNGIFGNREQRITLLEQTIENLEKVHEWSGATFQLLEPEAINNIKENIKTLEAAEEAVKETLKTAFSNEKSLENPPFSGLGSDPWQLLWNAAKEFCETTAYPAHIFPTLHTNDGNNAHCPLCLQELQPEAQSRFTAFHDFVEKTVVKKRDDLKNALEITKKKIEEIVSGHLQAKVLPYFEGDKEEQAEIQKFYEHAALLKDNVLKAIEDSTFLDSLEFPVLEKITDNLHALNTQKETELAEIKAIDSDPEKENKEQDYIRLGRKKALVPHKQAVLTIHQNRSLISQYDEASAKKLNTASLTSQKTNLMKTYFNGDFSTIFTAEKGKLGIRFPATLSVKQSAAASLHKAGLDQCHHSKIDEVLSEGEKRVLALAAFLTELESSKTRNPVIFDDPVSSLDHKFKTKISKRLVTLSQNSQVIIFTHDLNFLSELREHCAENNTPFKMVNLYADFDPNGETGKILENKLPFVAMDVGERLTLIKNEHLPQLKSIQSDNEAYQTMAVSLGKMIRDTWERLIEEKLFRKVVERFSTSVKTTRLYRVSIPDEVHNEIYWGMTKTSKWAHDTASAKDEPSVDITEIEAEILRIEECLKKIELAQQKSVFLKRIDPDNPTKVVAA